MYTLTRCVYHILKTEDWFMEKLIFERYENQYFLADKVYKMKLFYSMVSIGEVRKILTYI